MENLIIVFIICLVCTIGAGWGLIYLITKYRKIMLEITDSPETKEFIKKMTLPVATLYTVLTMGFLTSTIVCINELITKL